MKNGDLNSQNRANVYSYPENRNERLLAYAQVAGAVALSFAMVTVQAVGSIFEGRNN